MIFDNFESGVKVLTPDFLLSPLGMDFPSFQIPKYKKIIWDLNDYEANKIKEALGLKGIRAAKMTSENLYDFILEKTGKPFEDYEYYVHGDSLFGIALEETNNFHDAIGVDGFLDLKNPYFKNQVCQKIKQMPIVDYEEAGYLFNESQPGLECLWEKDENGEYPDEYYEMLKIHNWIKEEPLKRKKVLSKDETRVLNLFDQLLPYFRKHKLWSYYGNELLLVSEGLDNSYLLHDWYREKEYRGFIYLTKNGFDKSEENLTEDTTEMKKYMDEIIEIVWHQQ